MTTPPPAAAAAAAAAADDDDDNYAIVSLETNPKQPNKGHQ